MGEKRMGVHDGRWHLTNVEEEIGGGQERQHHPRQRQRRSKSPAQLGVGWGWGWKRGEERQERSDLGVVPGVATKAVADRPQDGRGETGKEDGGKDEVDVKDLQVSEEAYKSRKQLLERRELVGN